VRFGAGEMQYVVFSARFLAASGIFLKFLYALFKILLRKIGPIFFDEENLSMCRLVQQEIG